jgi:phenylpropionate dioxygenase-like ring-hydroxylating dioxygenase large terminal subunit
MLASMATSIAASLRSDVEIVQRVLAHIDAGTTDEGEPWREPVEHYVDPVRFADELRLLRSGPSVFVPSACVPNAGDHVERVAFGVPLFAVRGTDGRARVFRNACRHRGVSLVQGTGCSRALVCPYHGWTYRLDGALAHVPHPDGFPDLDTAARGLVEVASSEVDGLIVIGGVDAAGGHDRGLTDGAPWRDVLPPTLRLLEVEHRVKALNWKVLVEQFLEGYHIRSTHRTTFFPVQYDNLNVVETFGSNSRITYPYRNIERLRDRPPSTWTVKARLTFVYQLFPNVMVATFPDRVVVIVVDPVSVDRSNLVNYVMTDADADRPPPVRPPATEAEGRSMGELAAVEDNAMSTAVQRGLASGANEFVEFGRHESAIGHFHRSLDAQLIASSSHRRS